MADELVLGNPTLTQQYKDIQSDSPSINWFSFTHQKDHWAPGSQGTNDFAGLSSALNADQIQYVILRLQAVDIEYGVHTPRPKFALLTFVGPTVSGIQRRTILGLKEEVRSAFKHIGVHLEFDDYDQLNIGHVGQILMSSQGAHKCNYYQFGNDKWDLPAHA